MYNLSFETLNGNKALVRSDALSLIRDQLSVSDPAARFIKKKNPYYPDRKYCITKSGKFEIGLFYEIINCAKKINALTDIKYDSKFSAKLLPKINVPNPDKLAEMPMTPYDYQRDAVLSMFNSGRGTILVGTGGGKTLIMSLFIKTIFQQLKPMKTLVIVPSIQLVEQTYSDMISYGIPEELVSKWSGNNTFRNTEIIIAGVDILQSKESDVSFIKDVKILIIDEVHILKKENQINFIVDSTTTPNRFGFTGTLPENLIDQWNIFGKIGRVIYQRKSDELRNDKVISPVKVNIVNISYSTKTLLQLSEMVDHNKNNYQKEIEFSISNQFRNDIISIICKNTKQNTLVMVDRISHGETLHKYLSEKSGKKVFFIQGSVDVKDREEIRKIMENNSNIICIAISKVFSTGINVKNIHNIVFCTPGKAKVKLIQSIGRGLRLHKNKSQLIVYDIADEFRYSIRHLEKRLKLYDSENITYEIKKIKEP
jgi:superfamily II DNA or RNA helicase